MEDEIAYPGLVGAGIEPAQRSPYDRSFEPGEATTADVRRGLVEMLLSGLGLVKGGTLTPQGIPQSAGSRVRWSRRGGGWEPRSERGGADTGGLDLFNETRFARMVERKYPGARVLSAPPPISGIRRDVELKLPDGRVIKTFVSNFD